MNIAFIGNFATKKGSLLFKDLVLDLKNEYKWFMFGYKGDVDSFNQIKKYIKHSGLYEGGQLPQLLKKNKIDLCLILSIWPETYSKTFFEITDLEIPIIALDSIGFPKYIFPEYPFFVKDKQSIIKAISTIKENMNETKKTISIFNKKNKPIFKEKKQLKRKIVDYLLLG
jgi:hypothetical protein